MLTTVKGTYQDGQVQLDKPAPATPQAFQRVLVVFLDAPLAVAASQPRFSWDEALEISAGSGISLSDAVLEERREAE